ncbi:FtsX-like permease family protein [Facklamia hominis]|uniref:FtsX-like permease family protein n=1 Tax=Facklamia hominis TaxID=178214 RepID=UPI000C7E5CA5|nr:FtsX-like permease family protein [Facklamia hominis]PKY92282.1 ABC transporter permease [Facklamia hominis]RYC98086.1 ABC transporter permease [Facklamia hominis]WPJ90597.1 FtsX-like permease family protein [Facklamia hominis]
MNKKNFPVFISLLIVSLFFTVVFYYSYTIVKYNNESFMTVNFYDAELEGNLTSNDIEKIKDINNIELAGQMSIRPESAKFKDDLIAVNYQDNDINKMRELSDLLEGRFARNDGEIVLSKSLVEKNKLKLGDKIQLDFGHRLIEGKEIDAISTFTDKESYNLSFSKDFEVVGIYEDVYNKYSRVNYALALKNEDDSGKVVLKFNSFEKAYDNKVNLQNEINKKLGRDVPLTFNSNLIDYYGVEYDFPHNILTELVTILSVIGAILLFVFFVKNIFKVWAFRKIKELSVYKSIGTTDFQIYLLLLKEGIFLSVLPILIGHIFGYCLILKLFRHLEIDQGVENLVSSYFSPLLSLAIVIVALLVVVFSIIQPAKKVSKISIIEGIKGNLDFDSFKKKRSRNLWKELKLNNLDSVKSQRYISAIGVIIISVLVIIVAVTKYNRDFSYYDAGYNVIASYYSENRSVPKVFKEIEKEIPNDNSYISKESYIQVDNDLELSKESISKSLDQKLEYYLKKSHSSQLNGMLIALEDEDFSKLGASKGEFILYNMVQENPNTPVAKANKIPYFNNPKDINLQIGENFQKSIKISKTIDDLGNYDSITLPFYVKIYTDFDTFFQLMDESKDAEFINAPYVLNMNVKDTEMRNVKDYLDNKIRESIMPNEKYDINTKADIEMNRKSDLESLKKVAFAMAFIIFILNVTNGYSSINLSLMSRKKEIGSLYSCGMDVDELKNIYRKEFIEEQIKSFIVAGITTLGVMLVISRIAPNLSLNILIRYYDYKLFIGFSIVVYAINLLIYNFSLKRILDRPTIDLIRTE